jgi:uncharacterized membrane protein YfcA
MLATPSRSPCCTAVRRVRSAATGDLAPTGGCCVVEVVWSFDVHPEVAIASTRMAARARSIVATIAHTPPMPRLLVAVLIGLAGGLTSGLFGIGGGLVFGPGVVLLLRLDQHRAHATSSFAVVFTSTAEALRFMGGGAADPLDSSSQQERSWVLGVAGIVGALIGAQLAFTLSAPVLRRRFAMLLVVAGVLQARNRS